MTEKESFLKARLTSNQAKTLDEIVSRIQADTPEANVSASSVARHALEKYVADYMAKQSGSKLFIELDMSKASREDVRRLNSYVTNLYDRIHEVEGVDSEVARMAFDLMVSVMSMYTKGRP